MRYAVLVVFLLLVAKASAVEPTDEKLDAILKEIRLLNKRVAVLEDRVAALEVKDERKLESEPATRIPHQKKFRPLQLGPQEVLRMQTEEPGSLLKDIHQRERVLRKRIFYPDVF